MFKKLEISMGRALFWFVSMVGYWCLIFFAWWDTRFRVFLGMDVLAQLSERKKFSFIMQNIAEAENRAWLSIAESGIMSVEFMLIPLVMAVVLFISPFVVRRDNRVPTRSVISLPFVTLLCYLSTMLLLAILTAAMNAGIHYLLLRKPGPDFLMFLIHPLYLFYPLMKSVPGLCSQILYLLFIGSVLTTPNRYEEEMPAEEAPKAASTEDEDWDRSACVMEMDRLSRILSAKFPEPGLIHAVRSDISNYINRVSQVQKDAKLGIEHYQIVLTEAKNSLRRAIEQDRTRTGAKAAFSFVIDELERMEYMTKEDALVQREWVASVAPEEKDVSA